MLLIPAIDLKEGRCVRLRQGRMEEATTFSDDPVAVATRWVEAGARRLHLVDLNGAFAGAPVNEGVVTAICAAHPTLPVQIGGGIRDHATVERYLAAGVRFVIIGTKAVQEPEFVKQLCRDFPNRVIVGIDAQEGRVAVSGWADLTTTNATDLAQAFEQSGVSAIVYTDISRDGMMQGVNAEATAALAQAVSIPIIASGGITYLEDIRRLAALAHHGIMGAITGRAIYEGTLDLRAGQELADSLTLGG